MIICVGVRSHVKTQVTSKKAYNFSGSWKNCYSYPISRQALVWYYHVPYPVPTFVQYFWILIDHLLMIIIKYQLRFDSYTARINNLFGINYWLFFHALDSPKHNFLTLYISPHIKIMSNSVCFEGILQIKCSFQYHLLNYQM